MILLKLNPVLVLGEFVIPLLNSMRRNMIIQQYNESSSTTSKYHLRFTINYISIDIMFGSTFYENIPHHRRGFQWRQ